MKRHIRVAKSFVAGRLPHLGVGGLGTLSSPACMLAFAAALFAALAFSWHVTTGHAWADENVQDNSVNVRQTADNSFLYDTSIYELSQADASFQGNTVQIVGEVVGDSVRAEEDPGKRWITLEAIEEEYESSISVLVDESVISLIDTYGGYKRKGTTLQVRGIFYLACPSHEGIMDVHAESVTLVSRGGEEEEHFQPSMFKPGAILVAIGLVLTLAYHYLRARER